MGACAQLKVPQSNGKLVEAPSAKHIQKEQKTVINLFSSCGFETVAKIQEEVVEGPKVQEVNELEFAFRIPSNITRVTVSTSSSFVSGSNGLHAFKELNANLPLPTKVSQVLAQGIVERYQRAL